MFEPEIPDTNIVNRKRLYQPEAVQMSAKIPPHVVGKRTFAQDAAMYHQSETPATPREAHAWLQADARHRVIHPPLLEFTKPQKAWTPVGGTMSQPIPQPPQSPRFQRSDTEEGSARRRTPGSSAPAEPSARLMSRPERPILSPKLPLPKKVVDVKKLTDRMDQDVKSRSAKLEAARKQKQQALEKETQPANQTTSESRMSGTSQSTAADMNDFVRRMVEEPLLLRQRRLKALEEKLCSPRMRTPSRKLNADQQSEMSSRLYNGGMLRMQKAMESAAKKYIDDVAPKFAERSEAERREVGERLFEHSV